MVYSCRRRPELGRNLGALVCTVIHFHLISVQWQNIQLTFHFSKSMFSFLKCDSFLKCAFIFKMWKVLWMLFFHFLKITAPPADESYWSKLGALVRTVIHFDLISVQWQNVQQGLEICRIKECTKYFLTCVSNF